jgi:pyruvate kinase
VARGDLGVEMDVQRVPAVQKRIITLCNQAHRPVITATQILNSMEHSSRPTRAETSGVFNAVLDGADAVMLSGESAVGQYPVEAVMTMRRICTEAEARLKSARRHSGGDASPLSGLVDSVTKASVDAACLMTEQLDPALIVVTARSGPTALAVSNRRPAAFILALSRIGAPTQTAAGHEESRHRPCAAHGERRRRLFVWKRALWPEQMPTSVRRGAEGRP